MTFLRVRRRPGACGHTRQPCRRSAAARQARRQPVGNRWEAAIATVAQPFDSTDRVRRCRSGAGLTFTDQAPLVPMLVEHGQRRGGDGARRQRRRAYVLGDTQPLSNDGLRHGDSSFLALSLLQRARGGRISFDEYHHGEGNPDQRRRGDLRRPGRACDAAHRRSWCCWRSRSTAAASASPSQDGGAAAVPSASAYVTAMGQLFARSRQRGPIAARYADELKRRIGSATGVDWHLDDAVVLRGASP